MSSHSSCPEHSFGQLSEPSPKPSPILPLSNEAISQLHSSKHITSLQTVILCLVENALDAGASNIAVALDWRRGACSVEDNGTGIPAYEFDENGALARMYCTSKRTPTGTVPAAQYDVHGSTGTFLARLSAMSLLSITSTHAKHGGSASLTMHNGKFLARSLPELARKDSFLHSGTRVVVRDLFGNMPVRVKQRALVAESGSAHERQWLNLKRGLVGMLLAWVRPCSIKLQNEQDGSKAIRMSAHHPSAGGLLTRKGLEQLSGRVARYDLRDALPLVFQAGLAPAESKQRWVPLSASTPLVSFKGIICQDPAPTKQCQFISLGVKSCESMSGGNALYEAVNKAFANSNFGTDEIADTCFSHSAARSDAQSSRGIRTRGNGIDRHPMYCMRLKLEQGLLLGEGGDSGSKSEASLKVLVDIAEAAITAWLIRHNFKPSKQRARKDQDRVSSSNSSFCKSAHARRHVGDVQNTVIDQRKGNERTRSTDSESTKLGGHAAPVRHGRLDTGEHEPLQLNSDIQSLSRIRIGNQAKSLQSAEAVHHQFQQSGEQQFLDTRTPQASALARSDAKTGETPTSEDFSDVDDEDWLAAVGNNQPDGSAPLAEASAAASREQTEDDIFTWMDSVGQQAFRVNARTGVVLPQLPASHLNAVSGQPDAPPRFPAGIDTALSSCGKPLSLARRVAVAAHHRSQFGQAQQDKLMPAILKDWNNPVFNRQAEQPIPDLSPEGLGLLDVDSVGKCCMHSLSDHHIDSGGDENKLSKMALKHAEVLAQVDRKFILCKMPSTSTTLMTTQHTSGQLLALVDQHAASERFILESLLTELVHIGSTGQAAVRMTPLAQLTHMQATPLHFEVSPNEHHLLVRYHPHFATWGIVYDTVDAIRHTSKSPLKRITLTHLPTLIANRYAASPTLAIDLLRSETWALANGDKQPLSALPTPVPGTEPMWPSLLPLMPMKLLETLQSRSCRSAVMFNDVLSKEDCMELMSNLSTCCFPFVCAHGRCGIVPIVEIDDGNGFGGLFGRGSEDQTACRVGELARWMTETMSPKRPL